MHSICAFANDIHNWGGGYLILGVTADDGIPSLPPVGIAKKEIDKLQKEILRISNRIIPNCNVIVDYQDYMDKQIIIIWVPTGQERPYKAPHSLSSKNQRYNYYIRKGSNTCIANRDEEKILHEISDQIPFDDRINYNYDIGDINVEVVDAFLKEVGSDLIDNRIKKDKLMKMNLIGGPPEHLRPKNIALILFNDNPEKVFPKTEIDIVYFPDGEDADSFEEKIFKGPVHKIITEALHFMKVNYLKEKVIKQSDRPESKRIWNYSYEVLKESIANAMYHRSYQIREPVEIRVYTDKIIIINRPGPDKSITNKDLKNMNFISRTYRNNRIGDFLKELKLTEGRGTGIPKILRKSKENNSPNPIIKTTRNRDYFMIEIPINRSFIGKKDEKEKIDTISLGPSRDQVGTKSGCTGSFGKM